MATSPYKAQYYRETCGFETQEAIDRLLRHARAPTVLEAGCGSASHFRFKPGTRLVGIDISREQLARNESLSEKILGDIEHCDLTGRRFDAVVCHFVLEHLDHPERALENMAAGLVPGGILVIVAPNPYSLLGALTKFTPLWAHVLAYRYLFGDRMAGRDGRAPFRTPYRLAIAPSRVAAFAAARGLRVEYLRLYEGYFTWKMRRKHRPVRWLLGALRAAGKACTLRRFDLLLGAYTIILRRPEPPAARFAERTEHKAEGTPEDTATVSAPANEARPG